MADPIAQVTEAPKVVLKFGEDHLIALLLLLAVALVLFVAAETRRPGVLTRRVGQIPFVGRWALGGR